MKLNIDYLRSPIEYITGKKLSGFSGDMVMKSVQIPEIILDNDFYTRYSQYSTTQDKMEASLLIPKNGDVLQCINKHPDLSEQKICIELLLVNADTKLNSCYIALRYLLGYDVEQQIDNKNRFFQLKLDDLISSQHAWLKFRDSFCGLNRKLQQTENWLSSVAEAPVLSSCILYETQKRVRYLEEMKLNIMQIVQQGEK